MLFNEPKLLKCEAQQFYHRCLTVSVLFNEPKLLKFQVSLDSREWSSGFSALQRAEIAETYSATAMRSMWRVSVLFNEPKLLKVAPLTRYLYDRYPFQCSSTSRNC